VFPDANLKDAIESALGITDPNENDMLGLINFQASYSNISDLTGIVNGRVKVQHLAVK